MRARIIAAAALSAALVTTTAALALNGNDAPEAGQPADPAAGACLEFDPDCNDVPGIDVGEPAPDGSRCLPEAVECDDTLGGEEPSDDDVDGDQFDDEAARQRARDQLGLAESELEADVRVSRRGAEEMMLTEDYVLGRLTVALDDDGTGTFRVTSVVVELPDGPETYAA